MDKDYLEGLVGAELAGQILEKHQQDMESLRREHALTLAVERAGGRNARAIRALIDEGALAGAEDLDAAARAEVAKVKRENSFLFALPQVSSPGTGGLSMDSQPTQEELGKMSMAEYRRYRQGR